MYDVYFGKKAQSDKTRLKNAGLAAKAMTLIEIIARNPFETPPRYEKLAGDLKGYDSRRINRTHRIVYSVDEAERIVRIYRMWTHYE